MSEQHEDDKPVPYNIMLYNSDMVYIFASLRKVVRKHSHDFGNKDDDLEKVEFVKPELIITQNAAQDMEFRAHAYLKVPVSYAALLEFVQANRVYYDDDGEFNKDWKTADKDKPLAFEKNLDMYAHKIDAEIFEFDDEFSKKELVYGLIVNRTEKRIIMVFRGSYSTMDWIKDAMVMWSNPEELKFAHEAGYVSKWISMSIHGGFSAYLFGKGKDGTSKFDDILADIKEIYAYKKNGRDYSDYRLYITGHSLGGALTCLTGVALAGTELEKTCPGAFPVTAISYASPRIGGRAYRAAHVGLEKDKKLRYIRVSNQNDIVPVGGLPTNVQTGINVHLYDGREAAVGYNADAWFFLQAHCVSINSHSLRGDFSHTKHLHTESEGKELNADLMKMSMREMYKKYAGIDL